MDSSEITFLEPPLVKEILAQQRLILEMQNELLKSLLHPPVIYKALAHPKAEE